MAHALERNLGALSAVRTGADNSRYVASTAVASYRVLAGTPRFGLSWFGNRVAGVPDMGPLDVDPGSGGPLAHEQTSVLVGAEEPPELNIVVAR